MGACATPISTLAVQVAQRLEEDPANVVFWSLQNEIYTALIEASNDLLILIGRPTQFVRQAFSLAPNTVWQTLPKPLLLITDIQGPESALWKVSLNDMDYVQSSWGPDWETDVADYPRRWFPLGFGRFGVHPAVSAATQVLITGIAYPTSDPWPYNGTETIPFHHEFFEALEEYAAHYCRIKETGAEHEESLSLYSQYLGLAARMTQLEDRRDPIIFSKSVGGPTGVVNILRR